MSYIKDLIAKHGMNNVYFYGPASPLHDAGFIAYTSSGDKQTNVLFKVYEERHKIADDHKIEVQPLAKGFAAEAFYTADLTSLIDEGHFTALVVSNDTFDPQFVEVNKGNIFVYTEAHLAHKVMGVKIGPNTRREPATALFSIALVKGDKIELTTDNPDLWGPIVSFGEIDELNKVESANVVLVKQPTRKEGWQRQDTSA